MRIVIPPATPNEVVITVPGPQGPAGIHYQAATGEEYIEVSGRIFVGKDFPVDFPDGSIFFREV